MLCGEYPELDSVLIDLKLTPEDLDIPIPNYFIEDREKEIQARAELLDTLIQRYDVKQPEFEQPISLSTNINSVNATGNNFTVEQAIRLIQLNERGRQGRQRSKYKRELKQQEERERRVMENGEMQIDMEEAAVQVQRIFRGHLAKKLAAEKRREELQFLGMEHKDVKQGQDPTKKLEETKKARKIIQLQNKQDLEQETIRMREKIIREEGPKMKEDMRDMILEKIIFVRQTTGEIPELPSEQEGGSLKFLTDLENNPPDQQKPEEEEDLKSSGKKGAKKGADDKKKGAKPKDSKTGKKTGKKGDPEEETKKPVVQIPPSHFVERIYEGMKKYVDTWQDRENPLDFDQKFDPKLLREELMEGTKNQIGIERELLLNVDNLIREELANWSAQVNEASGASKSGKKGQADKKGGKKKKKKGGMKGDNEEAKDSSKGKGNGAGKSAESKEERQPMEPLYAELVSQGIVQKHPQVWLEDYIGCHRVLGSILNWSEPSMGQVRQEIAECILSLGSHEIHAGAPHVKSILLYGPASSGKTMLTHAIATETAATFFNLSPQNIAGKYEGAKPGNLVKAVFAVAKDMQPSVIYIDEIEKVLASEKKKGAKSKKSDGGSGSSISKSATRIKKELVAQIAALKPGERVLVVGNSRCPWEGEPASMRDPVFDRVIYTVRPDYGSRVNLWRTLISRPGTVLPNDYDLATLANISEGYTSGSIAAVVNTTLTDRRVKRVEIRPLSAQEFISPLAKISPVFREENDKFKEFTEKLPPTLRKRRPEDDAEVAPPEEGKGSKKGVKKGAKKTK